MVQKKRSLGYNAKIVIIHKIANNYSQNELFPDIF